MTEDPSATSSLSFPAHLRSPSVTLLFSLMAFVMQLLNSVARSINTIKDLAESLRGRGSDATTTLCDTIFVYWLFWGGSQAYLGCGCMCFQLLGLCAGTCSIYADLQSCLGVGIYICVDLRSHSVYSWTKAHTWRFCCAVRTIIMAHFLPFLYD